MGGSHVVVFCPALSRGESSQLFFFDCQPKSQGHVLHREWVGPYANAVPPHSSWRPCHYVSLISYDAYTVYICTSFVYTRVYRRRTFDGRWEISLDIGTD